MTGGRAARGWRRSSGSTWSARPRPSRTRRPSGTSASAASAGSSRTCGSRWRSPRSRAIRRRCSTGARTVVSAALCYYAPGPEPGPGEGRLPRYTWRDHYADCCASGSTRSAGGSAARTACSSTRTSTSTAQAAVRAGVGFYGKNTMLITRTHGSWVVLGTLVTDVEIEPTPPLEPGCGELHALHRRLPDRARSTSRACSTRPGASRTGRRRAGEIPDDVMDALGDRGLRLRHLPGRLPVEPRSREAPRAAGRFPTARSPSSRSPTGSSATDAELVADARPALRPAERPALAPPERARRARQRRRAPSDAPLAQRVRGRRRPRAAERRRAGASTRIGSARGVTDAGSTSAERLRGRRARAAEPRRGARRARRRGAGRCDGPTDAPPAARRSRSRRARDIERILSDPELISLRLERRSTSAGSCAAPRGRTGSR